jgi:hypothetical protein
LVEQGRVGVARWGEQGLLAGDQRGVAGGVWSLAGVRGRARVSASSFVRHCRRWQRVRDAALDGAGAIGPDIASTVIINRAGAQRLDAICLVRQQ